MLLAAALLIAGGVSSSEAIPTGERFDREKLTMYPAWSPVAV
jgi:hypothetical protein